MQSLFYFPSLSFSLSLSLRARAFVSRGFLSVIIKLRSFRAAKREICNLFSFLLLLLLLRGLQRALKPKLNADIVTFSLLFIFTALKPKKLSKKSPPKNRLEMNRWTS